jgi:CxxC motif-containing protein (DUF1111 family)
MLGLRLPILVVTVALLSFGLLGLAEETASEAPAGFDTPTLVANPGFESHSNGIAEPAGDTFATDQQRFELPHDVSTGLGPVFNARACADCHQNPVTGGSSQFTEIRAGHLDENGNFVNPTVPIHDGAQTITGRSIINDRAVIPEAQEHVPDTENIRALRAVLNTLGDGFVEAIDDSTLINIAANQPGISNGRIHGQAIRVPLLEAPGQTRIGRFGWKDQHGSLLSFIADAYLNEMGVTNRLRLQDTTTVGKTTSDPEDSSDDLGLDNIDHFAEFVRGTKVPPRDSLLLASADTQAGQVLFEKLGCAICHVTTLVTVRPGTVINAGTFTVPEALGNKIIHPYSDFLQHDLGTGDGIVQAGPQDTRNKMRTAPLWGLRTKSRFLHDLKSLSLDSAIERHQGEAKTVTFEFRRLTSEEKQQLFQFLKSL